jgi:hypothetical protein
MATVDQILTRITVALQNAEHELEGLEYGIRNNYASYSGSPVHKSIKSMLKTIHVMIPRSMKWRDNIWR